MNKEDIKSTQDFEAYVAEKEKGYCELIDKWIADGPTHKREKLVDLAKRLSDEGHISTEEYHLLLDCSTSIPKAGDGALNLSYAVTEHDDPNFFYKVFSSVAKSRTIICSTYCYGHG